VYPAEVERVLLEHPSVADVAVIGVPDERWGETVKAVVVPAPGAEIDPDDLITHSRRHLAGYKRPTTVDVVAALPRNATGKILRRELRAPYWEGRDRQV
jgi:acyl-CoA synthetase (AMP-forming)/AMP-acid ligase II